MVLIQKIKSSSNCTSHLQKKNLNCFPNLILHFPMLMAFLWRTDCRPSQILNQEAPEQQGWAQRISGFIPTHPMERLIFRACRKGQKSTLLMFTGSLCFQHYQVLVFSKGLIFKIAIPRFK